MKTIKNNSKYITQDTLNECFRSGEYTLVDKVLCGNGFSTRFLMERPVSHHANILIAPNIEVVKGKEREYKSGRIPTKNNIGFFYEGCESQISPDMDVLVMVSDSFKYRKSKLDSITIDKILIDEIHSIEAQGSFRRELVDFTNYVKKNYLHRCDGGIVGVSATPGVLANVDIEIDNGFIGESVIDTSENLSKFIISIKKSIINDEKVFIASNSPSLIYNIATERESGHGRRRLQANFLCGKSLLGSLCCLFVLAQDDTSRTIIGSSKAFEGHDLLGNDWMFYIYENRKISSSQLRQENIYQIINRCRGKRSGVRYFRVGAEKPSGMPLYSLETLEAFANDESILPESKMTKSDKFRWRYNGGAFRYSDFHKYLVFGNNNTTVSVDYVTWRMHQEKSLNDVLRFGRIGGEYSLFWKKRNVVFNDLGENYDERDTQKLVLKMKYESMRLNLRDNHDFITKNSLYSDEFMKFSALPMTKKEDSMDNLKKNYKRFKKAFRLFLLKRLHDIDENDLSPSALVGLNEYNERALTNREKLCSDLIEDKNLFFSLVAQCIEIAIKKSEEKSIPAYRTGRGVRKSKQEIVQNIHSYILELLSSFCNKRISAKPEIIGHRDYNIFTRPSMDIILAVFGAVGGGEVIEIDVRSSFIRILYGLCGLVVPDDVYGENKENKVKIIKR